MKPTRTRFLLCAVATLGVQSPAQNTLLVPAQYATVQAAIDAAHPQDVVLVGPGRYAPIDYRGKTITVKSSHGPLVTTLDGAMTTAIRPVVSMTGTGGVLEGFTVEGGRGLRPWWVSLCLRSICSSAPPYPNGFRGGGICATADGIVIKGNIVRNNRLFDSSPVVGYGAGIWAANGAIIQSNVITGNDATTNRGTEFCGSPCGISGWPVPSTGGGIFAQRNAFIADNVITKNRALDAAGLALESGTLLNNVIADNIGDGIAGGSMNTLRITNNTIVGNSGWGLAPLWNAPYDVINSVLYQNAAGQIRAGMPGLVTLSHCNVQGGFAGTGNFDRNPLFVDGSRGDFHLRFDSPCIDAGTAQTPLPANDFEGNVRIAGTSVDVGADEFDDRLYVTGNSRPGGLIHVKIIGRPGQPVFWAYSLTPLLRNPPVSIPGLGDFYLIPPIFVQPAGTIPAVGIVIVPVPLSAALPSGIVIPIQALIGSRLTNPHTQLIQ